MSKKRVDDALIGKILGEVVEDASGRVLVNKGKTINNNIVKWIKKAGYEEVRAYDEHEMNELMDIVREDVKNTLNDNLRRLYLDDESKALDLKMEVIRVIMDIGKRQEVILEALELKEIAYVYKHSVEVMALSILLGVAINLERNKLIELGINALLHDVGMKFVPKRVFQEGEKLEQDELIIVRKHPELGYDHLNKTLQLAPAEKIGILHHHERMDGTGYPDMKMNNEISLYGKILGIIDTFDAMVSPRNHRRRYTVVEALDYIMNNAGKQFDKDIINNFIKTINLFPINTIVRLSDQSVGVVTGVNKNHLLRPKIRIIKGAQRGRVLDLRNEEKLGIVDIVK